MEGWGWEGVLVSVALCGGTVQMWSRWEEGRALLYLLNGAPTSSIGCCRMVHPCTSLRCHPLPHCGCVRACRLVWTPVPVRVCRVPWCNLKREDHLLCPPVSWVCLWAGFDGSQLLDTLSCPPFLLDVQDVTTRVTDESEIIRKCLARNEKQCSFMEYRDIKLVYRRYASLYFIVGIDSTGA
jgi:hypothetical protein